LALVPEPLEVESLAGPDLTPTQVLLNEPDRSQLRLEHGSHAPGDLSEVETGERPM